MPLNALPDEWGTQVPLLSERVKESWIAQLNYIHDATSQDMAHDAGLLAKGFVVALHEAELIDEAGAHMLGTALVNIQNEAVARLTNNQKLVS
ncbi:hypothetical protein HX878_29625 [Pseudomonas veronii]|uniref:hypothetical protein n=1 Tax=Pseudomonas veronii TaxID=76761 RepID=UPI0015A36ECB|nr:hypothetical protein [Pseudomonas veronii]NWD58870.1 hypothetical protein [Pseudomonas veronii]